MQSKLIGILGIVATAIGFGATALSNWVSDQKMEAQIEEKVNKALAEREAKENEDETTEEES